MVKYCPTCNRSSQDFRFYGQFCEVCSIKKMEESLPKRIEIKECRSCLKIRSRHDFLPKNVESLEQILKERFGGYDLELLFADESKAVVKITEHTPDGPLSVEKELELVIGKTTCENCARKAGGYYEAIIQLRGRQEKMDKFIEKTKKFFESHNAFVAKVKEADNGFDIYLSDKKLARSFISGMGLVPNTSYTLYGMKNGKRLYRNTYAVRI
ncbi:60S ribosomal export protein NMD3 [Candidatus Marsarchaeota archaeon]|nr:60S ribosomal export protein NMD3 [Candidatus Marsarchaeota archaeon]